MDDILPMDPIVPRLSPPSYSSLIRRRKFAQIGKCNLCFENLLLLLFFKKFQKWQLNVNTSKNREKERVIFKKDLQGFIKLFVF